MRFTILLSAILLPASLALSACDGPRTMTPAQHQALLNETPDRPHPPARVASQPPADSSSSPLRCWMDGPDTHCTR